VNQTASVNRRQQQTIELQRMEIEVFREI